MHQLADCLFLNMFMGFLNFKLERNSNHKFGTEQFKTSQIFYQKKGFVVNHFNGNLCGLGLSLSWTVASFFAFLEPDLHCIATHLVVTINPVFAASLLAPHGFFWGLFGFFGFFGTSLGSRFGLLDLFKHGDRCSRTAVGSCSRHLVVVVHAFFDFWRRCS